jgi:hypothetical protein
MLVATFGPTTAWVGKTMTAASGGNGSLDTETFTRQ